MYIEVCIINCILWC